MAPQRHTGSTRVRPLSFLTSVLDTGEWSAPYSGCFNLGGEKCHLSTVEQWFCTWLCNLACNTQEKYTIDSTCLMVYLTPLCYLFNLHNIQWQLMRWEECGRKWWWSFYDAALFGKPTDMSFATRHLETKWWEEYPDSEKETEKKNSEWILYSYYTMPSWYSIIAY